MKMPSSSARCDGGNGNQVWPPGFRFHPTDEELVLYYLKRKVCGRRLKLDIIAETDVYKWDPEDLPGLSKLKTGDRLWFFFSPRDRKYPNGGRANRATHHGYWKATGKDRHITCNSRSVGLKKTLVFYVGRAPTGTRTDWVMHEYILDEEELKRCKNVGDYYALYKLYKKSGPGPKNGEQYGAPFKEEDWVDEECVEVGFNPVEVSIISKTHETLTFNVAEASRISEPLETQPASLVCFESDLNGLLDENKGVEDASKEIHDLCQLDSADFSDSFHQTFGHETQSTVHDPSGTGPLSVEQSRYLYSASRQYDMVNSFNYSLPAASQVAETSDINSGVVTSDPGIDELSKFLDDDDFFEANDLLGPEPFPSVEENSLANIKFDDTYDGLGEWDLFDDTSMFLRDTAANDVNSIFEGNQIQPQLGDASFATDELWGFDNQYQDGPSGFPSGSINIGSGDSSLTTLQDNQNHNDSSSYPHNPVTSALWDFIESIPTTPASASENILFSKALESVSSFRITRQSVRKSSVAADPAMKANSKRRIVLLFSIVGALCAMMWLFMTKTAVTHL